ncbi:hypothetical protein GGR53DRAFT_524193 [Hypoxylon sp. FL1150]|nr:hypothetical protein GGR53DRAFT_524193 [Hypoxylon sp. FL1150]
MCNENIYTYVYPDGHKFEQVKKELCYLSRHGQPCKLAKTFEYPAEYVRPGQLSPHAYNLDQFPPTPPLSTHSASASDSDHSSKERRGSYINGETVLDLNKRPSRRDRSDKGTVYVEGRSSSRTPPRRYSVSRSSPSSPHDDAVRVREPRRREKSPGDRERRHSSHSRPRSIEAKVLDEPRSGNHRRHGSNKSSSQSGDDEERRRCRRNSHVRFEDDEKQKKEEKQKKIDRANEDIANRPAVPSSQASSKGSSKASSKASSSARYRRGSVVVDRVDRPSTSLITAMDQLNLEREKRRQEKQAAEERQREEEEAQKQRLRERMTPGRRPTVTSGSLVRSQHRPRDDGHYY